MSFARLCVALRYRRAQRSVLQELDRKSRVACLDLKETTLRHARDLDWAGGLQDFGAVVLRRIHQRRNLHCLYPFARAGFEHSLQDTLRVDFGIEPFFFIGSSENDRHPVVNFPHDCVRCSRQDRERRAFMF